MFYVIENPINTEKTLFLDGRSLTPHDACNAALGRMQTAIDPSAYESIDKSRAFVEEILSDGKPHYGINTGFGAFENVRIPGEDRKQLQLNLIRSHSAGMGEPLDDAMVRIMMILRANALCRGHSGVRRIVIESLIKMVNRGVHPVVPSRGSVGASGDLAPLAHITLGLIGEGMCRYKGELMPSVEALKLADIEPVNLAEKEGLALINGTQLMAGLGCMAFCQMERILKAADITGAMSLEALMGTDSAFIPQLHDARPHKGQINTAENMTAILKGSEIIKSHKDCPKVQDPYSLRCIPAIHGAAREGLEFARGILTTEINSSVDNPLVFPEIGQVLSGGNFHGAPVALALETMTLGLCFIANVSERRTEKMINKNYSGLPPFLARNGGLNSGMMIAQYAAAALASENKVLCHPACCDTIPTSAGQEDHVSMGSISALKLLKVVENTWNILAVECLCGAEALEHRLPLKPGHGTEVLYRLLREKISPLTQDRPLWEDMAKALQVISHEGFIDAVEEKIGILN